MCKVLAFSNSEGLKVRETAKEAYDILTRVERDGFGYAVHGEQGSFGEKTTNTGGFKSRLSQASVRHPFVKKQHETFGDPGKPVGPSIFHSRTSTNVRGLKNCHPMQREGWNLIHNGVVSDLGAKYDKFTDNDSEDLLYRLIEGITSVEKNLSGYYAFAAIDPEGNLHIGKDSRASLVCCFSEDLNSYIFATNADIIETLAEKLKFKIGPIDEVADNVYAVIDKENNLLSCEDIAPLGYTKSEAALAVKSLGRSLPANEEWITDAEQRRARLLGGNSGQTGTVQAAGGQGDRRLSSVRNVVTEPNPLDEIIAKHQDKPWHTADAGEESAYATFRRECASLDNSYTILNAHYTQIELNVFRTMDILAQERCTIIRGDGSYLKPWGSADSIPVDDIDNQIIGGAV